MQTLLWNMFNATLWFVALVEGGFVLQFALTIRRLLAIMMEKCILDKDWKLIILLFASYSEEASLLMNSYL